MFSINPYKEIRVKAIAILYTLLVMAFFEIRAKENAKNTSDTNPYLNKTDIQKGSKAINLTAATEDKRNGSLSDNTSFCPNKVMSNLSKAL